MDGHSSSQWEGEGEASSHACLYKKVIVHAYLLSRYLNVFKELNGVSHVTHKFIRSSSTIALHVLMLIS